MAHLTTSHAKKSTVAKRKATSMHITRAKNGFSVRTHHEPVATAASKQQAMSGMYDNSPEETVHGSVASLKKHVAEKFGDLDSDEGLEGPDKGDATQQASVPMG